MSWLTKSANPAWIVVAIVISVGFVALSAKGYHLTEADIPTAIGWMVMLGASLWLTRFRTVFDSRDNSEIGRKHTAIVYCLIGLLCCALFFLKWFFPDVFAFLLSN